MHGFYDQAGHKTDFDTWLTLRDDVASGWVVSGKVFVSTCFQGGDADGEVILWQTRVTYLPAGEKYDENYSTRAEAVAGDREIRHKLAMGIHV